MKIHYYIKLPLELTTDCAEMKSNYRDGNCEDTVEECLTVFVDLQETQNRLHNSNSDSLCFFVKLAEHRNLIWIFFSYIKA